MKSDTPTINIPVDVTNPGQFFACCGLFELADRLWPGAEAWFEGDSPHSLFHIAAFKSETSGRESAGPTLHELLSNAHALTFRRGKDEGGSDDEGSDDSPLDPIVIQSPIHLTLDWWSEKSIKPWAGSMNERSIFYAMLMAIDAENSDPMNDPRPVFDPPKSNVAGKRAKKPEKREPFYFDCRRGSNAHPLDSGFSPDRHDYESCCFPAVEAMCFVGLQRARPTPTDVPNQSTYTVWTKRLPVNVIGPVVCGIADLAGSRSYTFDNFFRTDQRKLKSFSRATRVRSNNV